MSEQAKKEKAQPQEQPAPQIDPAEQAERVQKLIAGRIKSDNPVVCYMVEQLRSTVQEAEQLSNQLQQLEGRVTQMKNRLMELRGIRNKYVQDMQVFDQEAAKKENEALAAVPPKS